MPQFRLVTNVPQDKMPTDLAHKICEVVSKSFEMAFKDCAASVVGGVTLEWGGTNEPSAQMFLVSIGSMGIELNKKHSKAESETEE